MEAAPPWVRRRRPCCSSTSRSRRMVTTETPRWSLSSSTATEPDSCNPLRMALKRCCWPLWDSDSGSGLDTFLRLLRLSTSRLPFALNLLKRFAFCLWNHCPYKHESYNAEYGVDAE